MAHRSFAAAIAELQRQEVTFDLGENASFSVSLPLPGIAIASLGKEALREFDDEKKQAAQAMSACLDFFEAALTPEDFKRFTTKANELRVPIEMLLEIAQYVMEEASGRPTEQ